jgi:hypothetical protein
VCVCVCVRVNVCVKKATCGGGGGGTLEETNHSKRQSVCVCRLGGEEKKTFYDHCY